MKKSLKILTVCTVALFMSCGDGEKKKDDPYGKKESVEQANDNKSKDVTPASQRIDLTNKGIGSIESITLGSEIDQVMATHGQEVYVKMCTACHKPDKKFIGPSPTGILERRTPEWVMNMILNPEEMVQNDPLAKDLLMEFNGAPMANQNLTEEEARAVLEYFRTLK